MPDEIALLFLAKSRDLLSIEYRTKIGLAIGALPAGALWHRPDSSVNSPGNLLLHLAGNVRQWIVGGVGNDPIARDRAGEFAARDGADAATLLSALDVVLAEADAVIGRLTSADLTSRRTIQDREVSVLEAVYHVVEHFAMHTGQLILLAKELAPGSIHFYEDAGGVARPLWKQHVR